MMRYWVILLLISLTACQSMLSNEEDTILESDLAAYATEAANIRNEMQNNRTSVAATVSAASAQSANIDHYNSALRATIVHEMPVGEATRMVINNAQGPIPIEAYDLSNGEMRFVQVGTASQIDSQGCFIAKQQFFPESSSVIYMTAMALNLRAGTVVRVDWQYGGDLVFSNSWIAPQSIDGQCIVLSMRPENAPFLMGNWTATLSVNGEPVDPYSFTIVGG